MKPLSVEYSLWNLFIYSQIRIQSTSRSFGQACILLKWNEVIHSKVDDSRSKVSHESIVNSSRIIPVCGTGNSIAAANQETPRELPVCGSVDNLVTTANVGRPYLQKVHPDSRVDCEPLRGLSRMATPRTADFIPWEALVRWYLHTRTMQSVLNLNWICRSTFGQCSFNCSFSCFMPVKRRCAAWQSFGVAVWQRQLLLRVPHKVR